jgi:4-diphosphocytidyl-2-C-methyl-D-erythritol kinase
LNANATDFEAPSPAKINRFLHVVGRREDGYHRLQTLFQFLDRGDRMIFRTNTRGALQREDRHAFALPDCDLSLQAAQLLRQAAENPDLGVRIILEKRIPPGSGLGAGSSNAATTLLVLNRLWGLDLPMQRLMQIGRRLGADVAIFLHAVASWAEGVGDELSDCPADEPWLALLIPPEGVSTAGVFADPDLVRDRPMVTSREFFNGQTGNDLEPVTFRMHPAVAEAHSYLARFGAARMSGTGGAVFVPLDSLDQAERIVARAPDGYRGFTARVCNRSPLAQRLRRPCSGMVR